MSNSWLHRIGWIDGVDWIGVGEVSRRLGVTESGVYKLAHVLRPETSAYRGRTYRRYSSARVDEVARHRARVAALGANLERDLVEST